jgi:hypothetical protein
MLLLIDSRNRVNTTDDASVCKFKLTPAIENIQSVSLLSFDLPIPDDTTNEEGVFYFTVSEFGENVRGTDGIDSATFVLFREMEAGSRNPTYSSTTYQQQFDLARPRSINELNCRITYRNAFNESVVLGSEWNALISINNN